MATDTEQGTAVYVYGIVPADVEPKGDARGVGDPPGHIDIVRQGKVAALISEVPRDSSLGTPEDMKAHADVLDGTSAEAPVLPLRFGSVMADKQSVADELLSAHHDEFEKALQELEGRAEYIVKGRYDEESLLREILDENSDAARLNDQIRAQQDEDATRPDRIALGEMLNNAVAAKRDRDTKRVAEALQERGFEIALREATHEEDAFNVACLIETAREHDLEEVAEKFADEWHGRVNVRLLGPLSPYDFVTTSAPET